MKLFSLLYVFLKYRFYRNPKNIHKSSTINSKQMRIYILCGNSTCSNVSQNTTIHQHQVLTTRRTISPTICIYTELTNRVTI